MEYLTSTKPEQYKRLS